MLAMLRQHLRQLNQQIKLYQIIHYFRKNKFNLEVGDTTGKLPNICWTPKLHKNSTKSTFTIAFPKCSMEPFSKVVTVALKLIYKQI